MDTGPAGAMGERVRELVGRFAPGGADGVTDERALAGAGGLGFDSVRLVELLLACEDELGVALPVDDVLKESPLTVGRLVAYVARQGAA